MAIYYPKYFCGYNAVLKAKARMEIEIEDNIKYVLNESERVLVKDIIGYGYDLYPESNPMIEFRIMNSGLANLFDVEKIGTFDDLGTKLLEATEYQTTLLVKPLTISGVFFKEGTKFIVIEDKNSSKPFFNLYDETDKILVLRLSISEFEEYFEKF